MRTIMNENARSFANRVRSRCEKLAAAGLERRGRVKLRISLLLAVAFSTCLVCAQSLSQPLAPADGHVLGPGDRISVSLRDRKEIEIQPVVIDLDGTVDLAYAGRLLEVLSLAEGLKTESGNVIKITRPKSSGLIPRPGNKEDSTGQFYTAQVSAKGRMEASVPEANIPIRPHDIITVPRAELVYLLGAVHKAGGFPVAERESIAVLQALAMGEGVQPGAVTGSARTIRATGTSAATVELSIDVKKILASEAPDQPLLPNDILFIPDSTSRNIGIQPADGSRMAAGAVNRDR